MKKKLTEKGAIKILLANGFDSISVASALKDMKMNDRHATLSDGSLLSFKDDNYYLMKVKTPKVAYSTKAEKPVATGIMTTEVRKVVIELIQDQLGTVPKDPTVYKSYIESKKPEELEGEDESANVPVDLEAKGWTGFMSDENGCFVYDYLIKGFLKNAANQLKDQLNTTAMRSKVVNQLFVHPRKIYFGKDKPDGLIERPIQCQTAQGPRVSLARSDSMEAGTQITFYVEWLVGSEITEKKIIELLKYGRLCGLGQFRTGGYGRFVVRSFEPCSGEEIPY